jgi:hypothetical protein
MAPQGWERIEADDFDFDAIADELEYADAERDSDEGDDDVFVSASHYTS